MSKKAFAILLVAVLAAGIVFGGVVGYAYTKAKLSPKSARDRIVSENGYSGSSTQELLSNPAFSDEVRAASDAVQKSVVVITTRIRTEVTTFWGTSYAQENSALGSGFIFKEDSEKYYIMTNAHVIADATSAQLYFDSTSQAPIYLVGESDIDDVAIVYVLKEDIPQAYRDALAVAKLGDSDQLRAGDLVVAIGSPYSDKLAHTTTVGIVTAIDRDFSIDGRVYSIGLDASINPGNSGGALVNANGEVIGVNSAGIRDGIVEGMNFAIPINVAKRVADEAFSGKTSMSATMGITSGIYLSKLEAAWFRVEGGLYIYSMSENCGAAIAGIRPGDLITKVGDAVLSEEQTLEQVLADYAPGDVAEVTVVHNRNVATTHVVSVTLDGRSNLTTKLPTDPEESN